MKLEIGKKAFLMSLMIIISSMVIAWSLGKVIEPGIYERTVENGREVVIDGTFNKIERPSYPIWKIIQAPIQVFSTEIRDILIVICALMILLSGSFSTISDSGLIEKMLKGVTSKIKDKKMLLIMPIVLFLMLVPSIMGLMYILLPLVMFMVPMAVTAGWDKLTGLGLSFLPLSLGFMASISNPHTVVIGQKIAGLPLYSGTHFRILFFITVYIIYILFLKGHIEKIENSNIILKKHLATSDDIISPAEKRVVKTATIWFLSFILLSFPIVLLSMFIEVLRDISIALIGTTFAIATIGSAKIYKTRTKAMLKSFAHGVLKGGFPAMLLIVLSLSISVIIEKSQITDTIIHAFSRSVADKSPPYIAVATFILTFLINFFVPGTSTKMIVIGSILIPISDIIGVTRQTIVSAVDYGDGLTNNFFPTNTLVIIALGLTGVGYWEWVKWVFKLMLILFIVTSLFLAVAATIKLGPF